MSSINGLAESVTLRFVCENEDGFTRYKQDAEHVYELNHTESDLGNVKDCETVTSSVCKGFLLVKPVFGEVDFDGCSFVAIIFL